MLTSNYAQIKPKFLSLSSQQNICLRLLQADDVDILAQFYESIPAEDYRFYLGRKILREDAIKKAGSWDSPYAICLNAIDDDSKLMAGYAWCEWSADQNCSVFGICIARTHQGSGLGRTVMQALLDLAKQYAPPCMSLTVQKANPQALALYQKMGFKIIREQLRKSDQEPEYYMELQL